MGDLNVSDTMLHPAAERLDALVEGNLAGAERLVVESHLVGCSRCQTEVEELRALFSALARLQHFDPAPGFVNRVMSQVRLPEPWWTRAGQMLGQLAPRTSRGWAFASAMFALPLVGIGSVMLWLLSKPYISGDGLVAFTTAQAGTRISAVWQNVLGGLIKNDITLFFARSLEAMANSGFAGAGSAAALFAGLSILSVYVLYQNLFRSPARSSDYVSYSF
jgi:hypothetical protein